MKVDENIPFIKIKVNTEDIEIKSSKNRLDKLKKCKKYNLFVYFLFLMSVIFYFISLKGCKDGFSKCQKTENITFYIHRAKYCVVSSIIFDITLLFQFLRKLSKINILFFFTVYIIIFSFTQGTDFYSHGTYNFIAFIFLVPVGYIYLYLIYLFFYYMYNKERKKFFLLLFLFILQIVLYLNFTTCDEFYDGLGGIKIDNDEKYNSCYIKKPSRCGLKYTSNLFDVNYFRKTCKNLWNTKEVFTKYFDDNKKNYSKYFYPRTEFWDINSSYNNLKPQIDKAIDGANDSNSKDKEVFVNFENNIGKIEIKVKRNETLVQERRKIAKNEKIKFNNVYIIYIDAISRKHFMRKFKKTSKLIEEMLNTNTIKKEQYKNFNSYQFLKYHNFIDNTVGNNFPLIYGTKPEIKNGISMTKFFKSKGFITAATHNSCNREIFDWGDTSPYITTGWDHENFALFCDSNFYEDIIAWSITKGKSSVLRKCFYDHDSFEYEFEYILQFLEAYKDERKFFKISFADGHEGSLEVVKFIDDSLYKFLIKIFDNYFDEHTAIFIISDHGAQLPSPQDLFFRREKTTEQYLGIFFLILHNEKNDINQHIVHINEQRLVTPFDIHDTLLDMININKYEYPNMVTDLGQSVLEEIDGLKRSCENYGKLILEEVCFCKPFH